jgi:hypothetical protein
VVSRPEGYRRSAGKEQIALAVVQEFFRSTVGVDLDVVTDKDENYRLGDLRSGAGVTIECKGQPIDPLRYRQNFVEVFEETHREDQADGFEQVARLLDMSPQQLTRVVVTLRDGKKMPLGWVPFVSVSFYSLFASPVTTYVNYRNGGKWVYVYDRAELTSHIKSAVRLGMRRGIGNSNEDTFSVFVPMADKRWQRDNQVWSWVGSGDAQPALAHLLAVLNGEVTAL